MTTHLNRRRARAARPRFWDWECWALPVAIARPRAADAPDEPPKAAGEGVSLAAEQVQKLGIITEAAKSFDYTPEVSGYGVVIPHDGIATAVAELATAQAAADQSRAVAARAQRLAGTPGAMAADTVENATRQVASDNAALELAQRRLVYGDWRGHSWRHRGDAPAAGSGERQGEAAAGIICPGCDPGRRSSHDASRPPGYGTTGRILERASALERAGGPEPAGT